MQMEIKKLPLPPHPLYIVSHSLLLSFIFSATVVGLKAITYNVSESDKVVKICISAVGANTLCPSRDPFQLLLNTLNQSAGVMAK